MWMIELKECEWEREGERKGERDKEVGLKRGWRGEVKEKQGGKEEWDGDRGIRGGGKAPPLLPFNLQEYFPSHNPSVVWV